MAFTCLSLSTFAQHPALQVSVVHDLPGGGTDNGSTPVNLCTSQTYSASIAAFGNSVCTYSWINGSTVLGTGPSITLNIGGPITLECVVGYDTLAFCTNLQYASGFLTQQVNEVGMSGPLQVCTSPQDFTLSNLPPNPSITWSTSSDLEIVGGQGTPTVQVEEVSAGAATVTANISATCIGTMAPITSPTTAGPRTPTSIGGMINGKQFHSGQEATFSSTGTDWHVSGGTILDGQGTTTIDVQMDTRTSNPPLDFSVQVRENDACGISGYLIEDGTIVPGGGEQVVLAPNPASGTVTLSAAPSAPGTLTEQGVSTNLRAIQLIRVYDVTGKLRKSVINQSGSLPLRLDVSDLNNGVYFLEIFIGKDTERQKLVIKH